MWIQKETKYIKRENSDNKYVQICNTTAKYNPVSLKLRLVFQSLYPSSSDKITQQSCTNTKRH